MNMKYSLVLIVFFGAYLASFSQNSQEGKSVPRYIYGTRSSTHGFVQMNAGYVFPSLFRGGSRKKGTDDGYSFSISYDRQYADSSTFIMGSAFTYANLDICGEGNRNHNGDFWSYGGRWGCRGEATRWLDFSVVSEVGIAYLQSRHEIDGARYKSRPSLYVAGEMSAQCKISRHWGYNIFWKFYYIGRDCYKHGKGRAPQEQRISLSPHILGIGVLYDF